MQWLEVVSKTECPCCPYTVLEGRRFKTFSITVKIELRVLNLISPLKF